MSLESISGGFTLSPDHSTTRLVTLELPVIAEPPNDTFKSVLFLPEGEGREGEGGLRTQGYFKHGLPDKPLLTIITVIFNGEEYLEETILSVINQTYDNVEYIIIDGGSCDGTLDIIRKYEHTIDYWVSEKDSGIYDAMNKGIKLSFNSDLIYFLGGDDKLFHKEILSTIIKKTKENMFSSIYYGYAVTDKERKINSRYSSKLLIHNSLHHQTAFYRKELFENFLYDLNFKRIADYELNLLAFTLNKKATYIEECIAMCRDDGVSTNKKNYFLNVIESNSVKNKIIKSKNKLKMYNLFYWLKSLIYYVIRYK